MVEAPSIGKPEPAVETIVDGSFEEELTVDADEVGTFLVELGEQLQAGREIELTGEGWRIPFTFAEPVELEIEFEGGDEPELEIEFELEGDPSASSSGIV
jgi:amphi-Trp domain-containing protein